MIKVEMIDKMGSDLSVVNAARVSYAKVKNEFEDKDTKLIGYLAKHGHWSPFAHASISFRIILKGLVLPLTLLSFIIASDFVASTPNPYSVSVGYIIGSPLLILYASYINLFFIAGYLFFTFIYIFFYSIFYETKNIDMDFEVFFFLK